jgi:predicted nucleotidyltransferase
MNRPLFHHSPGERAQVLEAITQAVKARPQVLFAYVHGSFLEDRAVHDVDVGLYLDSDEGGETTFLSLDLAAELEQALPAAIRLPVDVRILNQAPLGFRYHVFRGRLLFSRNEPLRTKLLEETLARYLDLQPLQQHALKEAMTAWT